MTKQETAKSVINDMFNSSLYMPSYDSGGNFKFIEIKQNIDNYNDIYTIKSSDVINYSFDLTKLEDVKNYVTIKYNKNYATGDYDEQTTFDFTENNTEYETLDYITEQLNPDEPYSIDYYKLKDIDSILEVETDYIRDPYTAARLKLKLLMWHCNQHLTAKIDLPPNYMDIEAGDYLKFDELIGNQKAFGFDYTQEYIKNGQLIYPVFFVNKVNKSLQKVSIEILQIHSGNIGENLIEIDNPYDTNYIDEYQPPEVAYLNGSWRNNTYHMLNDTRVIHYDLETNVEPLEYSYKLYATSIDLLFDGDGEEFTYDGDTYYEGIYDLEDEIDVSNLFDISIINTETDSSTIRIEKKIYAPVGLGIIAKFVIEHNDNDNQSADLVLNPWFYFFATPYDYPDGDANLDYGVNVLDIVLLINNIMGAQDFDDTQFENVDLNADGVLNILDIVLLVGIILD